MMLNLAFNSEKFPPFFYFFHPRYVLSDLVLELVSGYIHTYIPLPPPSSPIIAREKKEEEKG